MYNNCNCFIVEHNNRIRQALDYGLIIGASRSEVWLFTHRYSILLIQQVQVKSDQRFATSRIVFERVFLLVDDNE